jgi:hypothetical protein
MSSQVRSCHFLPAHGVQRLFQLGVRLEESALLGADVAGDSLESPDGGLEVRRRRHFVQSAVHVGDHVQET